MWNRDGRLQRLSPTGGLLGLEPDSEYQLNEVGLSDVRRLLFYTDGVTEARDSHGQFFGEGTLIESIGACGANDVEGTLDQLMKRVISFAGGRLQDDATIVLADFAAHQ